MRPVNLLKLTLCIFLLLAFYRCTQTVEEKAKLPENITVLLIDYSQSTRSPAIQHDYVQSVRKVINRMDELDALYAAMITDRSVAEHRLLCEVIFPAFKPTTDNELYLEAEKKQYAKLLQQKRDSVNEVLTKAINDTIRKISATDILSSLRMAEKLFLQFPDAQKRLVLLSDMMEESDHYNFNKDKLTRDYLNQVLSKEEAKHAFPDLKNVEVFVAGADADNAGNFEQIQNFWLQYFQKCGATCPKQNYAAMLINF